MQRRKSFPRSVKLTHCLTEFMRFWNFKSFCLTLSRHMSDGSLSSHRLSEEKTENFFLSENTREPHLKCVRKAANLVRAGELTITMKFMMTFEDFMDRASSHSYRSKLHCQLLGAPTSRFGGFQKVHCFPSCSIAVL